ncbi:MAG TPA: hypothetical protein VFM42_01100 [Sphingomicrobium sp.]|jgi:hypothetical protein|nr:hypothetical protein [Sphingomicrobium sp.]
MTFGMMAVPLGMMLATLPVPAVPAGEGAPAGTAETRYCLRVDPDTGSRVETIQCRTREEWATLDVDVDREWSQNGVRVIG